MTRHGCHAGAAFPRIQLHRVDAASSSLSVVGFYVCTEARNVLEPFDRSDQRFSGAGMLPTTAVLRKDWGFPYSGDGLQLRIRFALLFLHPQMHEVNEVESAMLGLAAKTILHVLEASIMTDVDVTVQR